MKWEEAEGGGGREETRLAVEEKAEEQKGLRGWQG